MVLKGNWTGFVAEETDESFENGYTLTETLVALVIFVSVLIPLTTTIGKTLFDRSPEILSYALREAQTAIGNATEISPDSTAELKHDLTLQGTSKVRGSFTEIEVRVVHTKAPGNVILTLRSYRKP
jgi:hypothetical protein